MIGILIDSIYLSIKKMKILKIFIIANFNLNKKNIKVEPSTKYSKSLLDLGVIYDKSLLSNEFTDFIRVAADIHAVWKYIKLNAEILDFNVDKEFNYCVDGMIFLNLDNVPVEEITSLTKGSDDPERLLKRFS